jgi:hypothetical protein
MIIDMVILSCALSSWVVHCHLQLCIAILGCALSSWVCTYLSVHLLTRSSSWSATRWGGAGILHPGTRTWWCSFSGLMCSSWWCREGSRLLLAHAHRSTDALGRIEGVDQDPCTVQRGHPRLSLVRRADVGCITASRWCWGGTGRQSSSSMTWSAAIC